MIERGFPLSLNFLKKNYKKDLLKSSNKIYNFNIKKRKKVISYEKKGKVIVMIKKYSYQVEFLSREVSPMDTMVFSATGECSLKEMKQNFQDFLKKYGFSTKGTTTNGSVLNAKGQVIGKFAFGSQIIQ